MPNVIDKNQTRLTNTILSLSVITIIASAFHFWPFEKSQIWQTMNLPNLICMMTIIISAFFVITGRNRDKMFSSLPHVSVFAYLVICSLSMAFAIDFFRSFSFTSKLWLILIGGFTLFSLASENEKSIKTIYHAAIVAAIISVSYCIFTRFFNNTHFGFHVNVYKYGTYIGILVPLCVAYLISSNQKGKILLGALLIICAYISSGSLGAIAALSTGLVTAALAIKKLWAKCLILGCLAVSIFGLFAANIFSSSNTWNDLKLSENDGKNLRQRYIEWQAEINILKERAITGTASGCVNDQRSKFYYRLPKLNTLQAFDQNGWLSVAAETGILGLLTFLWIIVHYGRTALKHQSNFKGEKKLYAYQFSVANLAGFSSACVANIFSSVHYNGILIIFVMILSLISSIDKIYDKESNI